MIPKTNSQEAAPVCDPIPDHIAASLSETPSISALQLAAQAWCMPETASIEMNTGLAYAFAKIIEGIWSQSYLGNATTDELLTELRARVEVAGLLQYRTTAQYCACPIPLLPIGGWQCARCDGIVRDKENKPPQNVKVVWK